ncbi:MAG: UDP-N-acetylmuramate--L-alanine ligase [Bacteroidia bacterium]
MKMRLSNIHNVYLIGIGGIGMSALARYFNAIGKCVGGYDKTPTKLTDELIAEGICIHFEDEVDLIPEQFKSKSAENKLEILIVYTPAVPVSHKEFIFFKSNGFALKKRAEVLGLITENSYTVAVAGTHGKTTTSSLIAHIFKIAGLDPSAFLGGVTQNYNTNLILNENLKHGGINSYEPVASKFPNLLVVEADEYDRSFLTLYPKIAVITSVDADHLDIYGDKKLVEESYNLFARQVKSILILKKSIVDKIKFDKKIITYSLSDNTADYYTQNIQIKNGVYYYDVVTPSGIISKLTLGVPGLHNLENSIAAIAVAFQLNISEQNITTALASFKGVRRRFEYHIKTNDLVFIDDYAHHPEELKAAITSVKAMYPTKKITGIFQPHLFSRTRDFADEFAKSLDLLDECILMEIYPAREKPIDGIDSSMLLNKMHLLNKTICQKNELVNTLVNKKIEVLLTMGAGDIDTFIEPIKNQLIKSHHITVEKI